jgi:hypothetical protein
MPLNLKNILQKLMNKTLWNYYAAHQILQGEGSSLYSYQYSQDVSLVGLSDWSRSTSPVSVLCWLLQKSSVKASTDNGHVIILRIDSCLKLPILAALQVGPQRLPQISFPDALSLCYCTWHGLRSSLQVCSFLTKRCAPGLYSNHLA